MVIDSYEKNPKIKLGNYEMKLKEKKIKFDIFVLFFSCNRNEFE
jgi:hypothetical protein